ncbi:RDD family protein [Nocardioides gilvus]|uniref:RDD family protein n=1 Tax=Nocardioides gilvus TaxID=1735589 RepID=UPI000D743544|nr:RDD family protein [Nocardioides gilvus]
MNSPGIDTSPMDDAPVSATAPYASLGRRIGAYLIDGALPVLLLLPGYVLLLRAALTATVDHSGNSPWGNVLLLCGLGLSFLLALVQWHGVATKGQSIGKRIVGIRVVDADSGAPIGWGRAFLRYLVLSLLGSLCALPLLIQAFVIPRAQRRQGWHDGAVNSVVLLGSGREEAAVTTPVRRVPTVVPGAPTPLPAPPPPPMRPSLATGAASAPPPVSSASTPSALTLNQPPAPTAGPTAGVPRVPPPPVVTPPPLAPPAPPAGASPAVPVEPAAPVEPAGPVEPAAPVEPVVPAAPVEPAVPVEPVEPAPMVPAAPVEPAPSAPWRLVADGTTVEVSGTVVIGRQPSVATVPDATAVRVDDPQRTMSKTHAVLRGDADSLSVEDLSSTNGVYLLEGSSETRIPARTITPLVAGARVAFGDYAFVVERAQ